MSKTYISLFILGFIYGSLTAADIPGTLDTSFSSTGIQPGTSAITIAGQGMALAYGVAIQQNGKIILSGPAANPYNFFCLARLNLDGSLDATFNASSTQPGVVKSLVTNVTGRNWGVALQQDGKIVTSGWVYGPDRFAVARFNADGTLDTTFNPGGVQPGTVTTLINSTTARGYGVAIQQDGKIVVVGNLTNITPSFGAVARFNIDGTLDATFNAAGTLPGTLATTVNGVGCQFGALAIQQDGKIVAVGGTTPNRGAVARFNIDGTLDMTFNPTGTQPGTLEILVNDNNTFISGVAIQQDGKILLSGSVNHAVIGNKFIVARLNIDGSLDTSFNSAGSQPGIVTTFVDNNKASGQTLVVQQDGKIVVAGNTSDTFQKFAFARFNTDGTLDTSFNPAGVQPGTIAVSVENAQAAARNVTLQKDGKIIAVGRAPGNPPVVSSDRYMTVVRLFGGGSDFFTQRLIAKYNSRVLAQQG